MLTLEAAKTISGVAGTASVIAYTITGMELNAGAESYKVLAQGLLSNLAGTLYTVPGSTQAFIKSLHLANTSGSAVSGVKMFVGGTAGANQITGSFTIPANGWATCEEDGWRIYNALGEEIQSLSNLSVGSTVTIDVQTFTANGSWAKPAGAVMSWVRATGGGAAGGSGRKDASTAARGGGSGASGGNIAERLFQAGQLGSTETIVVAAAVTGAAAQTVSGTNGNTGADGNDSSFGTSGTLQYVRARGGGGGLGGSTTSVARGQPNTAGQGGVWFGNDGGVGDITSGGQGNAAGNIFAVYKGPAGGGGGAGNGAAASGNLSGGAGGLPFSTGAGAAGGLGTGAGTTATVPGGGGGGGGCGAAAGGAGGNGLAPGGGGGGGGAGSNGSNSGAGGDGARGEVVVYTLCVN